MFCSKVTKENYKIRQEINFCSRNVIYLVNCMKCPKHPCVGKTETFQARISKLHLTYYSAETNLWDCETFLVHRTALS